ncbi:MAG TPA: helix-turn-helix transcriptional regulator [Candidatus Angelobacter sp.]|nr:helix-turn-helix transcriptional regulator [Candidatus Angelobacter sp.]
MRQKLGARIRRLREQRGWSQETFAHESGFARSFTSGLELGKKDIRLSTILKLSRIFGLSISQLFKNLD